MLKFCPKCGNKLFGDRFCGNCGADLTKYGAGSADSAAADSGSALDAALDSLVSFASAKQEEEKKYVSDDKLRVMIIRGMYDEAKVACEERIERDPMDMAAYLGLVRIVTDNYKKYEGEEIAEQVRIAEEVFGGSDKLKEDAEYAAYLAGFEKYSEEKREKEEAERKRIAESFEIEDGCLKKYKGNGGCVVIPDGVKSIGACAFYKCSSLTSIEIPNSVTSIGREAFRECSSLTSIVIPNGVKIIEPYTFYECSDLIHVEIPNTVNAICERAFYHCDKLLRIEIPHSVKSIGKWAFICNSLMSAFVPYSCFYDGDTFPSSCSILRR